MRLIEAARESNGSDSLAIVRTPRHNPAIRERAMNPQTTAILLNIENSPFHGDRQP
jgi:hypothetical protein